MGLTLGTAARNAACDGVVDLVDGGAGAGKLKIMDAGSNVLVTITLADPAFGASLVGVATASSLPRSGTGTAAAGAGVAPTKYDVTDSDDNVIWSGTIPSNMTIDSPTISVGQTVNVTSWTHTQPAT